jgi:hypothetical protein
MGRTEWPEGVQGGKHHVMMDIGIADFTETRVNAMPPQHRSSPFPRSASKLAARQFDVVLRRFALALHQTERRRREFKIDRDPIQRTQSFSRPMCRVCEAGRCAVLRCARSVLSGRKALRAARLTCETHHRLSYE